MRHYLIALAAYPIVAFGQQDTVTWDLSADEVVVVAGNGRKPVGKGGLTSIDEHLQQLDHLSTIRRGGYAWEPVVNNMTSERIGLTIDGMKIFYACTDKMDPATSYVESVNLQRVSLNSGIDGNPQSSGNIGGSLDLRLRKAGFAPEGSAWAKAAHITTGVESNGWLRVAGADVTSQWSKAYIGAGAFVRKANNYFAGGHQEIEFSQFQKINVFVNAGWQPQEGHIVEGTVIWDRATNVGYPALNMDVGKAEGRIAALTYRREGLQGTFGRLEAKVYANHITHEMDDTHRPNVTIHMDMPGDSKTVGFYAQTVASTGKHYVTLNVDGFHNALKADMTMYPGGSTVMYMLTWPDVHTSNIGLAGSDDIELNELQTIRLSGKASWQRAQARSEEGFRALEIYFPGMSDSRTDAVWRLSARHNLSASRVRTSVGIGLGNRAPSASETYGYFLNNTFDRYDYMGNPNLKGEQAIEGNAAVTFKASRADVTVEGNIFRFRNYIAGVPDDRLSAMTVGAAGVKVYENLRNATIANLQASALWRVTDKLTWQNKIRYALGRESTGANLPLVEPLTWDSQLAYSHRKVSAEAHVKTAARQWNFAPKYGETETAGYAVAGASVAYSTRLHGIQVDLRTGVENIGDKKYSTYSDWNGILQKGRNWFLSLEIGL